MAELTTEQRRYKLHRALYEWKDYGGSIEDVLEAISDYVIGMLNEQRRAEKRAALTSTAEPT